MVALLRNMGTIDQPWVRLNSPGEKRSYVELPSWETDYATFDEIGFWQRWS
jgi:hypothetical protein